MSYFWQNVSDNGAKVCWYRLLDPSCYWNRENTEPFNNFFFFILFFLLLYAYQKVLNLVQGNKRLLVIGSVLSAFFALAEVVGHSLTAVAGLDEIFSSHHNITKSIIRTTGYFSIFFSCITFSFEKLIPKLSQQSIEPNTFPTPTKKHFLICVVGCNIMYSLFIIKYWPMIFNFDTLEYIGQVFGYAPLTNHHPVFNAWITIPFIKIGQLLGNINIGIFLAILLQLELISIITAYTIYTISKLDIPHIVKLVITIIYALYPVYAHQAAMLCKDTPFGYATLVFVLCLLQLAINKEHFFKSKLNIFLSIAAPILMMLHRNNGFHVILLSTPFIIWFCKDKYKKVAIIFTIGVLLFNFGWNTFIKYVGVTGNWNIEKYSMVSQQLSRIAKTQNLNQQDKDEIQKYINCPLQNFTDKYLPEVSDPTKGELNISAIENNTTVFLSLSLKMLFKFPITSIEAFLCTTSGFWYIEYPETPGGSGSLSIFPCHNQLTKQFITKQIFKNPYTNIVEKIMSNRNIPVINMLFRSGFMVWAVLFCFAYCIYKKKYNMLLVYTPLLILWLTCIASPYVSFRYVFGIVTSLPVIFATLFVEKQIKN